MPVAPETRSGEANRFKVRYDPQVLKEKNTALSQELKSDAAKCRHRRTSGNEKGCNGRVREEKHEEEKDKQSEEIERLRAQLSAAQKQNEKLKGGMFGMSSFKKKPP